MTDVDEALLATALEALAVEDIGPIGAVGGQKTVRQVRRDGDDYVLKVISVDGSNQEMLRRAEREVSLLASLSNPHVVHVESALTEIGTPAIGAAWLEEYLDGRDLTHLLGQSQWTWSDVADLGIQIAHGLAPAHEIGVIHRDLSPNNVRCLSTGTYKVLDFGFARFSLRSGLTVAGQPGTPGFLSPEHVNAYSGSPMASSDIFCVGILMYYALTAQIPVPYHGNDADYVRRLINLDVDDLTKYRSDLSKEQRNLVMRCLHPQPARRFRNGKRLATALEGLV